MTSLQSEFKTENGTMAFVMINCQLGHEYEVLEQLRDIKEATEILPTFGIYDILAKIESPTVEQLRDIILLKIRKIENIYSTTILMRTSPKVI